MSSSKSKENEIIRKKEDILSEKDVIQRFSITNEDQDRAIIKIELQNKLSFLNFINQMQEM